MKQFSTTNSKGKRYYLKFLDIRLRSGHDQRVYFFSHSVAHGPGTLARLLPPASQIREERLGYLKLELRQLTLTMQVVKEKIQ